MIGCVEEVPDETCLWPEITFNVFDTKTLDHLLGKQDFRECRPSRIGPSRRLEDLEADPLESCLTSVRKEAFDNMSSSV